MNGLDQELAQVVAEAGQGASVGRPAEDGALPVGSDADSGRALRRRVGLVAGLGLMAALVLGLLLTSVEDQAIYSKGVDDLVAERARLVEHNVRVDGSLVRGTLLRREHPCEFRFTLEKNGAKLDVRYPHCVVPDSFRDLPGTRVDVTVEGRLSGDGYLLADRILAKCPSRYEMDERVTGGAQRPHASAASSANLGAN